MIIDIEKVGKLIEDAGKIFISPEGEDVLIQLLDLRDQIELAIDQAETTLEKAGLEKDPNFTSIQSAKIKVYYRAYGSRFAIDESSIDILPKDLYQTKITFLAVADQIEKYAEEHKGLPLGIIEKERVKQITFSKKEKKEVFNESQI